VPACPQASQVTQPDGTKLTIFLRGDENAHWTESQDGYLVNKDEKTGTWSYVTQTAVPVALSAAGKSDPLTIGAMRPDMAKLSSQAAQRQQLLAQSAPSLVPSTGVMRNLVVLVNFSDLAVPYPRQNYDDLFNQIGYTIDGAVGSVKDYYLQVSYNALTVQSTVVEAVTLDNGYAYYGANDAYGDDIRPREMVAQALAKLETRGFDFKTVDGDGDGWVDGLTIIHAGGGEEYSGNNSNYIWSHKWALSTPVTYDGVSMQVYHTEPARRGWDNNPSSQGITRIGVICHENGHFLGLPDLYDYGYDSKGVGNFCLMAGGSWNGSDGTTPAQMSAWCKSSLGWVSPIAVTSPGSYSLNQVETSGQVYKLQGPFPSTQYFLVENRQPVGFDSAIPGSLRGILIWHVDETVANNNDQTHYKVDIEEASGTQHLELNQNSGDDADYFRFGNATAFTAGTTPNNLSYTGQPLGLNITNVSATGASMSLTVSTTLTVTGITPSTGATGTNVNVTNLAGTSFAAGATVKLTMTGQADIVAANVVVVGPTQITCTLPIPPAAATGVWNVAVTNPDAQSAALTNGFTIISAGLKTLLSEGFESAFVSGAPVGWSKSFLTTGSVNWIRNSGDYRNDGAHSGTYNALLYIGATGNHKTYLVTPSMNFPAGTQSPILEFWHKQALWSPDQDTLTVYYKTSKSGVWTLLASYTANITTWTKETIALPNVSSDYYIGFLGNAKYGYGVCIDDVLVTGVIPNVPNPDINGDKGVNLCDIAILASHWQQSDCSEVNAWCAATDLDHSGVVDIRDLWILAENWLAGF
jgi:M6 family metalloprotease-like protein